MKEKRYYREWLAQVGWGVMLNYNTVMAKSKFNATKEKPFNMYAYDESFEYIIKVKKKHLHLTDLELSKIYGRKRNESEKSEMVKKTSFNKKCSSSSVD